MYLPYLGNSLAPNWNSDACGVFFGVRPTTSRAHFIRALIEGVAFDLYSNVKIAQQAGVSLNSLTLNGGPTKSRFWNQITANVVNLPLNVTDVDEAAPLGDAILAAVGCGFYPDPVTPVRDMIRIRETIEPDAAMHQRYEEFFEVWREVYESLKPSMSRQSELMTKHRLGQGG
jgi:xylulokinase